ncbi:MAG: acyltransferase [Gemmatimonadaceae bacterium]
MARTALPEHNLDLLRSVAVMGVLANHSANALIGHVTVLAAWLGQAGVQAFFVHTSLVLMGSMERDGAPGAVGWIKRFYVRRVWRIYPLVIVVIAVVLFLHVPATIRGAREHFSTDDILANLALVQNLLGRRNILSVLWTLPLELQMYIALPLCFLVARNRSPGGMLALLAAGVAAAILYTSGKDAIPGLWRLRTLEFVPCFLSGVLAYWLLQRGHRARLSSHLWIAIIVANLALGYAAWTLWPETWFVRAAYCMVFGMTIPLVADMAASRVTRAAHSIATYSYGIYLIHPIALWLGFRILADEPLAVQLLAIAVSLTLGSLAAYHLVEKPGIEIGRRMTHQRARLVAEPAAP